MGITAQELRIGNYIYSGKEFSELSQIGKVLEIGNEEREFEQIYCECDESFEWFFKGNYCGIPLTEEWLLRFGFNNHGYENLCWSLDKVTIYGTEDTFGIRINDEIAVDFYYVHQLQNFYFAITGEELTIKQ